MSSISYYDNTEQSILSWRYSRLIEIASNVKDSNRTVKEHHNRTKKWLDDRGGDFEMATRTRNGLESARTHLSALRSALVDAELLKPEDAELTKAA